MPRQLGRGSTAGDDDSLLSPPSLSIAASLARSRSMRIQLRELLRRLCVEIGWSYAVFWRPIRRCDQMELVWEDGYCKGAPVTSGFEAMDLLLKEKAALRSSSSCGGDPFAELGSRGDDMVGSLVYKVMANQVHAVGDGIVGQAALTGHHRWIHPNNCDKYGSTHKGLVETCDQFLAGIQTIAMIPVLPHGVVQLGSAQMVMENRGFINHVRNLFAQLGCVPCDFRTDVTQRPSSHNAHLSSPLTVTTSLNQFGSSDTYTSRFASLDSDRCNHQLLKASDSVTVSQPCSSFTDLHGNLRANAIEVSLTTNSSTVVPPTQLPKQKIQSVSEVILHQLSQLKNGHVRAEVMFLHPDGKLMENAMLQESSSGDQHQSQILTSTVSSNEQLLSISGSRASGDDRPNLDSSKNPQMQLNGCNFSLSTKKSDNILSFDHYISTNNINGLGKHGSFSSDTTSSSKGVCPIPFSWEGNQMLDCAGHSNNSQMLSRDSSSKHRESYAPPFKDHQKSDDNLHEAVGAASNEFDGQYSCYGPQLGTQGTLLSCLNPDYELKGRKGFVSVENNACIGSGTQNIAARDNYASLQALNNSSHIPPWCTSGDDLFDLLGLDRKSGIFDDSLGNILLPGNDSNANGVSENFSTCITQQGAEPTYDAENDEVHTGLFSDSSPDQLLDAVVAQIKSDMKQKTDDNVSCKTSLTRISNSTNTNVPCGWVASSEGTHGECLELSPVVNSEAAGSSSLVSGSSADKAGRCFQNDVGYKSGISLWVENDESLNYDSVSVSHSKRIEEACKLNRKRPRAGENPRPRPKDRQMIQDRLKELREIVPNGSKCSIDALLEKTIKHMLFLQSVTTHADKLKEVEDSKIMSKDGGVLLKDNFKRGATWAFEVGSQSMICPIIVEDLNPPRQMLVEMLCEERGLFLEIADLVKGLGLTILKGVMENRNDKIWARFAVEANRDVTRMEIFLSLVRLLEPNAGSGIVPQGVESVNMPHPFQSSIPATGLSDHLR